MDGANRKIHTQRAMKIPACQRRVEGPAGRNSILGKYTNNQQTNPPHKNPKGQIIHSWKYHVRREQQNWDQEIYDAAHGDGHYESKNDDQAVRRNEAIIEMAIAE